ncbi:PfkB family carbohydrate kinase [Streptomyces antimycoticus]|uniref:PfkB family carbohydrate kinase n=1 Tax=Streptomyces antimycoticus TaxID=68175 RepID=UPI003B972886
MSSDIHQDKGPAAEPAGMDHVNRLAAASASLDTARIDDWGRRLAILLSAGKRILVAGNGGSAAEAQHLTSELVGRYRLERPALSALALHADSSTVTALGNDYGYDEVFARQVRAHGRPGDVLLCLSTSGSSPNLLRAVEAAAERGLTTWAFTGRAPNPLAERCDETVAVDSGVTATIQECHLAAIHMLCTAVDATLLRAAAVHTAAESPDQPRPGVRIVVVGDTLLDRDLTGAVERLSPEAPVPVVEQLATVSRPGGAGLAAVLAARDGGDVTLVTALATDAAGEELRALLAAEGVEVVDLGLRGDTPVKSRIRGEGRTLVMLDQAGKEPGAIGEPPASLESLLRSASAVLVSDYGRGIAALPTVRDAVAASAPAVPVVWDPHPRGLPPVAGVCLVTPNRREAGLFADRVVGAAPAAKAEDPDGLAADIARARALLGAWRVPRIAVTRGAAGAVLVEDTGLAPLAVPAESAPSGDSVGAGDRFAAATAGLLAQGRLPSEAVTEAVVRACAYVAAGGASALAKPAPTDSRYGPVGPVALAERVRAAGGRVIATGGCFDILHAGHAAMLANARRLGDCLIVCLNGDASVARLKGPRRPVVPVADRVTMLTALRSVDAVLVFEEDTPARALELLRPHVYVKGGDYAVHELPEASVVENGGGHVVTLPYVSGHSTTSLIEQATGAITGAGSEGA